MKLRKHVRGQRLTDVRLVPGDRLLCLSFGSANWTHHLLMEFYAGGNIILCDGDMRILSVLRPYTGSDGNRVAARHEYPLDAAAFRAFKGMDAQKLEASLAAAAAHCATLRAQQAAAGRELNGTMRRQMELARLLASEAVRFGVRVEVGCRV